MMIGRSGMSPRRPPWRTLALWLVLALACAFTGLAGCGASTPARTSAATATATFAPPTATPATIPNFPLTGWQQGGPAWATAIAFAPGSSTAAYTCGANGSPTSGGLRPISLGVSTDGAKTWAIVATPAASALCSLSVDPTNPRDVALFTTTCSQNCTSDPVTHLYRSRNQGGSWSELAMPALPADGAGPPSFTSILVWSGATLIAETTANVAGGKPVQHLLASVNAAPFARVDQASLFQGATIGGLFALTSAVYVEFYPAGCTGYICALAKTTDGGATWRLISLAYQQQSVDPLAGGGTALIVGTPSGAIEHAGLARTGDDGQTWQALPATPAGLAYYAMPDGTLFLTDLNSGALYRLAPGAQSWQVAVQSGAAAPTSLDDGSLVYQCDAAGHPVAVWRDAGQDQNNNNAQYPGLQYHPL